MPHTFEPGATLEGRYRLVSEEAPQDLGSLYRAYDTVDDELVMVLVVPFEVPAASEVLGRLSRMQGAVAALGQPALVSYEYGGVVQDRLYLVRREIGGRPLAELIARGPLDAAMAAAVTIVLADLVALLHRAGIVHGSLSPYCVYVDLSGASASVSITDCGLLPALREFQSPPGRPWGRSPYLSPEQAAGEEIHSSTDVYLIGSLLYTMLAGRPPFRATDETILVVQHLRQAPPALDVLLPELPPALVNIVDKALAKEPSARYRNAGQLGEILRSHMVLWNEESGSLSASVQLHVPAPPGRREAVERREPEVDEIGQGIDWVMIALIVAALLAMLGLVGLWRIVYERYAAPGAALLTPYWRARGSVDGEGVQLSGLTACVGEAYQPVQLAAFRFGSARRGKELDDRYFIWYNRNAARPVQRRGNLGSFARLWSQDYGFRGAIMLNCHGESWHLPCGTCAEAAPRQTI